MYQFKLPDIGEGLHEAELLAWDVQVGDTVAEGDSIAQISTDKVNVELPSPCSGVITELPWSPGDIIPVGQVLARIDDGKTSGEASEAQVSTASVSPARSREQEARQRFKAAPAVRRYAAEKGVDLAQVQATGPGGAVTRADVDALADGESSAGTIDEAPGVRRIKLSGPRLAAAKRLEASSRTLATSAMNFEVPADEVLTECSRLAGEAGSTRVTPLAVVARHVCRALAEHANFNAVIDEHARALDVHDAVHLGIAVDSDDGLLVPVILDAHRQSALELARAIESVASRARAGELSVADFQGSTFTISSTASIEEATITATTPIINFPNVATLWVSRIRERPRVTDGTLEAGPMMSCALAFDHRFIHGADATRFINTLENALRGSQ